nr:MAG TPA: hypothetical protein [Caudoviricetes sp.]
MHRPYPGSHAGASAHSARRNGNPRTLSDS